MSNPIGWRSGRLVVIKEAEREARSKRRQVLCKCDCGNQKVIRWSRVKGRITKSCGCIKNIYRKSYLNLICTSIQNLMQEGGKAKWQLKF